MQATSTRHNSKRSDLQRQTYSLAETASLFGVSYTTAHEMAQRGAFPIKPLRIGRLYLFPKVEVDRMLGIASGEEE